MYKILFQIKEQKLYANIRKKLNIDQKSLINTNVISQNELVFSEEYIIENYKLVHNFLKELIITYNLNTIVIREFAITPIVLNLIKDIPNINTLYLLEESILNYKICDAIIKTNNIKYISLYNIPTFLLEMLDKENIKVDSRNEILFSSKFMEENNLFNFSSLYYKTEIYLDLPLNKEDEEDFLSFMNINKYLKCIYINKLNKNDIENILDILYKYKLKKIKIYIKQNIHDIELIEYLKKINKKNSKTNGIRFLIDYSKEYLEDNLINQIQINTVKSCIFISLALISSVIFYVFYSNYASLQKVEDIQKEINSVIAENRVKEEEAKENNPEVEEENPDVVVENDTLEDKKLNNDVASLLSINEDTVGWLKVNDTNIDYPVVQAEDNDYYLTRNFYKQKDNSGWIFMDYRADSENLSKNTIIFGHNMYYSKVMFGTLYKAKYSNWYTKESNQIIEFDTKYDKLKWHIFSIYVIPNTNDYLIANFSTDEKYQEFLDLITDRSIYDFNMPVATSDKILTLSTCSNNGKNRLVIHAVLLPEE